MGLRKNIRNLLPDELSKLREAHRRIMARIDNRSYQHIASMHGWLEEYCEHPPFPDEMGRPIHLFLPWHRAYMYHFERYLQIAMDNDNSVTVPWWNWRSGISATEGIPATYTEENIGTDLNPLYAYRMNFTGRTSSGDEVSVNRDTRRSEGDWLTLPEIRDRLAMLQLDVPQLDELDDFAQFSERLRRGWHNHVHGYVGGDMGDQNVAAYDPIFYPHHVNLDRVWAIWQVRHGVENIPTYMKDVVLRPFAMTVRQVLDVNALEYDYASGAST
ncbi:MAG: tyrosinase family protein [Nitrososphaeraceae archaeon]